MEGEPKIELKITTKETPEQLELKQGTKERLLKENEFFNEYLNKWARDPRSTKYGVEIPVADVRHLNQIPKIFRVFASGELNKNCLFAKLDSESPGISTALFRGLRQSEELEKDPEGPHNICSLLSKYIEEKEISPSPHGRDIQNEPKTISVTSDPAVAFSKDSGERNYSTPGGATLIFDRERLNKIPHKEGISTISEIRFEKVPLPTIKGIYIGKEESKKLIEEYKGQKLFAEDKTIEEIVIPHNFSEEYHKLLKEKEEIIGAMVDDPSNREASKKYWKLLSTEMDIMRNYRKESLLKIISFLISEPEDIKTLLKPRYEVDEEDVYGINGCLNKIKKERSKRITDTSKERVNIELKRTENRVNTQIREIEKILSNAEIETSSRA